MLSTAWAWFRNLKDAFDAVRYTLAAITGAAVLLGIAVLAFLAAFRNLSLHWQIAFFVGLFLILIPVSKGIVLVGRAILRRWFPSQFTSSYNRETVRPQQIQYSNLAISLLREDREDISNYIEVDVKVNTDSIFHKTRPTIGLDFNIRSSAVYRIEIGNEIKGSVAGNSYPLGHTPKLSINNRGEDLYLRLIRGGEGSLHMVQETTAELRERWIQNDLEKDIAFNFERLFISVDLFDPEDNSRVIRAFLTLPIEVKARLHKVFDWNWQDYDETFQSIKCTCYQNQ